jgi:hypothetical protein
MRASRVPACCLILSVLFGAVWGASAAVGSAEESFLENNEFLVVMHASGYLDVLRFGSGEVTEVQLGSRLARGELCPDCSLFSGEWAGDPPAGASTSSFVLDLRDKQILTGRAVRQDRGQVRWCPGARYGFFRDPGGLLLVPNERIRAFVESQHLPEGHRVLQGHPLGDTWVEQCLGPDSFVFGTGTGEGRCWGLVDISRDAVFLLTCRGIRGSEDLFGGETSHDVEAWKMFIRDPYFQRSGWLNLGWSFFDGVHRLLKTESKR